MELSLFWDCVKWRNKGKRHPLLIPQMLWILMRVSFLIQSISINKMETLASLWVILERHRFLKKISVFFCNIGKIMEKTARVLCRQRITVYNTSPWVLLVSLGAVASLWMIIPETETLPDCMKQAVEKERFGACVWMPICFQSVGLGATLSASVSQGTCAGKGIFSYKQVYYAPAPASHPDFPSHLADLPCDIVQGDVFM